MPIPARRGRFSSILGLTAAVLLPSLAFAAGTEIPDNGAAVLGRGATSVGLLDTAYSLQFNPGGLSTVNGLDVRVDVRFVNHEVSFLREETDQLEFKKVFNTAGPQMAPMAVVAYRSPHGGLLSRFGFGLGVWAPPGVRAYTFADHRESDGFKEEPRENWAEEAGQRYSQISSQITILYPSLGVSYRLLDNLSLGATLSSTYASLKIRQAMAASFLGGENTAFDAIVDLDVAQAAGPAMMFGATYQPISGLTVAASVRPQVFINASGPLQLQLPDNDLVKSQVQIISEKPTAKLALSFPPIIRLGANYRRGPFAVTGEFLYEMWSTNKQFLLTPDIKLKMGGEEKNLDPIEIPKNWQDAMGGRLGLSWDILPVEQKKLSVQAFCGGVFETNAIPSAYQQIDFVTGNRLGGSLGATVGWDAWALTVSGMVYAPVALTVTDSKVESKAADGSMPLMTGEPVIIGNGAYTSNVWLASVGLAYRGLGAGSKP